MWLDNHLHFERPLTFSEYYWRLHELSEQDSAAVMA